MKKDTGGAQPSSKRYIWVNSNRECMCVWERESSKLQTLTEDHWLLPSFDIKHLVTAQQQRARSCFFGGKSWVHWKAPASSHTCHFEFPFRAAQTSTQKPLFEAGCSFLFVWLLFFSSLLPRLPFILLKGMHSAAFIVTFFFWQTSFVCSTFWSKLRWKSQVCEAEGALCDVTKVFLLFE